MEENKYMCVACGTSVDELYKQYSPTVIKVTNCHNCGSICDKYIEYDSVIIMMDLILLSKEAYRHVLFNTSFKIYWKVFIVLIALETYLEWSYQMYNDKLNNTTQTSSDDELCNSSSSKKVTSHCKNIDTKIVCENDGILDNNFSKKKLLNEDPFLIEKGVYVTFCCVCVGMLVFCAMVFLESMFIKPSTFRTCKVNFIKLLKALTLGGTAQLFILPTVIWGSQQDLVFHANVLFIYTTYTVVYIHSVIYECRFLSSLQVYASAFILKIISRNYLRNRVTEFIET